MKPKERKAQVQKMAQDLGDRIAKELRGRDPVKEAAYREAAARREAETLKELAAHMAKLKKK